MILKIQIPLSTIGGPPECLIYNEDHSVEFNFPMLSGLLQVAQGRKKFFVDGEIDGDTLRIDAICLGDPGW